MYITKTIKQRLNSLAGAAFRRAIFTASFASILIASAIIGQNLLSTPDQAQAITPPDSCFNFDSSTQTIVDYYDNEGGSSSNPACPRSVDIPGTIGGVVVVRLGDFSFMGNQLASVSIPDSVTHIGDSAFFSNQLISVTIPASVASIGNYAFQSNQLTSVTIENVAATLQNSSFVDNPISTMTIGASTYTEQSPTTYGACFRLSGSRVVDYYQASPLVARSTGVLCGRNVTIPASVTSIGNYAFQSNQLTSVTIPDSVTSIGEYAFSFSQLTSVTIPNSVTSIGDSAFRSNQLTSVSIPNSVTSIGDYAFSDNQLTSVTIPNSVTSIGNYAFMLQNTQGSEIEDTISWSDDLVAIQQAYGSMWYAQIFTEDPSNPHNIKDTIMSEDYWNYDANANGTTRDSYGGGIINPARVTLRHVNKQGDEIAPPVYYTGVKNSDGKYLTSYLVSESAILAPIDPYDPTPEEQADLDAGFGQYYRAGQTRSFDAPNLSGYLTPDSATRTLQAGDNVITFTYTPKVSSVSFADSEAVDGEIVSATQSTAVNSKLMANSVLAFANHSDPDKPTCSTIQQASLLDANHVVAPKGVDLLGGIGFALSCEDSAEAVVNFTLGEQYARPQDIRIYKSKSDGSDLTDITSRVAITNQDGRTLVSYVLIDGGSLDEDGIVNGVIVDPVYVGVLAGASGGTGAGEKLASTGVSLVAVVLSGSVMLAAGGLLISRRG